MTPPAALLSLLDDCHLFILGLIEGAPSGLDMRERFGAAPDEVLDMLAPTDEDREDALFIRCAVFERARRRGKLVDWKLEIVGKGKATLLIKPVAALQFITLTTEIGPGRPAA